LNFGARDVKIMLLSICEVRENQRMEGLIFYGRASNYLYACTVKPS